MVPRQYITVVSKMKTFMMVYSIHSLLSVANP